MRVFTDLYPKGSYVGQRNHGYPLDNNLKKNLDFIKERVLTRRTDFVLGVDGRTGAGKSTIAMQIARYLDSSFSLDRVAFTPQQFANCLKQAKKGEVVLLDEAIVLNSRNSMSEWNKKIMMLMAQIRSKQLFIIFCLPSIFDLDKNISLFRIDLLIHCYQKEFGKRGFFTAYFQDRIKTLYLLGKKYYSYNKPKPNLSGTFSRCFTIDEDSYEKKKQQAINSLASGKSKTEIKNYDQRNNYIRFIRQKYNLSYGEIAEIGQGLSEDEIGRICRNERGGKIALNSLTGQENDCDS